jgi:hypothetical protein
MSIELHLPAELETKLAAEASRQGISLPDYVVRILSNGGQKLSGISNGGELVAYWRQAGVVGSRTSITDSQRHARELRAKAERREHS